MTELSAHERLRRGTDQIHNPVALATKYLASRHLLGGRDEDDLMDVAIQAVVNAAIAWEPNAGRTILSWAWLYMDRDVARELARCVERRDHLDHDGTVPEAGSWLRWDPSTIEYTRAELRVDLQRWADLAELTPLMRFIVEYAALHYGTYVRDTPYAGLPTPLAGSGATTLKLALKHMRRAAVTNERRDDKWTRMRAAQRPGAVDPRQVKSDRLLARLRAVEAERDARALVATAPDSEGLNRQQAAS